MNAAGDGGPTQPGDVGVRLANNSRWNLVAFFFTMIAHFVTVPFVIARIGLPAFGEAGLVIAIWAPLLLVGTVLGQASTRAMAQQLSQSAIHQAGAVAGTAIVLGAFASIAIALFFVFVGPWLLQALSGSGSEVQVFLQLFVISAIGWVAQQGVLVLQSISAAQQNYKAIAVVSAASAILLITATLGSTSIWPTSLGYLAGISASFSASLLVWWIAQRADRRRLGIRWQLERGHMSGLLRFGKWQGLSQFVGAISLQMDRYMLGGLAPSAVVGHYNVAMRLQEVVHMGLLKANEVLFPHFSATTQQRVETRAAFFLTASWLTNLAAACMLVPLIPLARPLIELWVDIEAANGAAPILRVLAMAGVMGAGAHVYIHNTMARGRTRHLALLTITHAILAVTITATVVAIWGAVAAGLGLLIANSLRLVAVTYLGGKAFANRLTPFALSLRTVPPLLAGVVVGGLSWCIGLPAPTDWATLGASYFLIAMAVGLVATLFASLSPQDREMLRTVHATIRQMTFRRGR